MSSEKWDALYEWTGHIQDHLRQQDAKLDEILRILRTGARDDETIRQDVATLADQVTAHERKISELRRDTPRKG